MAKASEAYRRAAAQAKAEIAQRWASRDALDLACGVTTWGERHEWQAAAFVDDQRRTLAGKKG